MKTTEYSESVINLSRTTVADVVTLHTAERMLKDRGLDHSEAALARWCELSVNRGYNLLHLIGSYTSGKSWGRRNGR